MRLSRCLMVCLALVVVVGLAASVAGCKQKAAAPTEKPALKVGSDTAYPPFESVEEKTGEFVGFDMDLIRAICDEIGMKAEIQSVAWDGIIPGLLNGNYDVIISAMTITDERAQSVNFSDPYFTAGQVIVAKADNTDVKVPADLKGRKVAVQINTTGDFAASKIEGVKEIKRFPLAPDTFVELKNGNVDAVVIDIAVAVEYAKGDSSVRVAGEPFTVEYYGMAMRKTDTDLLKKVNKALATLKSTGKYDEIYNKYFSSEPSK